MFLAPLIFAPESTGKDSILNSATRWDQGLENNKVTTRERQIQREENLRANRKQQGKAK